MAQALGKVKMSAPPRRSFHRGTSSSVVCAHARTHVLMLVQDLEVRIINAATGELLRELTIDLTRDYQPLRRPPGPTPAKTKGEPPS
jgi:hypothetical protein